MAVSAQVKTQLIHHYKWWPTVSASSSSLHLVHKCHFESPLHRLIITRFGENVQSLSSNPLSSTLCFVFLQVLSLSTLYVPYEPISQYTHCHLSFSFFLVVHGCCGFCHQRLPNHVAMLPRQRRSHRSGRTVLLQPSDALTDYLCLGRLDRRWPRWLTRPRTPSFTVHPSGHVSVHKVRPCAHLLLCLSAFIELSALFCVS